MVSARSSKNHIAVAASHTCVEGLRLLTVKEVTALTGLGRSTLYAAMAAGKLCKTKVGGATRFRPADIAAYIGNAA